MYTHTFSPLALGNEVLTDIGNFQTHIKDRYLEIYLLKQCDFTKIATTKLIQFMKNWNMIGCLSFTCHMFLSYVFNVFSLPKSQYRIKSKIVKKFYAMLCRLICLLYSDFP